MHMSLPSNYSEGSEERNQSEVNITVKSSSASVPEPDSPEKTTISLSVKVERNLTPSDELHYDNDGKQPAQGTSQTGSLTPYSLEKPSSAHSHVSLITPTVSQYNKHARSEQGNLSTLNFSEKVGPRKSTINSAKRSTKSLSKIFQKMDELAEADQEPGGQKAMRLYGGTKNRVSRYSKQYRVDGESNEARSSKITPESREYIATMHELMKDMFAMLEEENDLIPKRDFTLCNSILGRMKEFQIINTKLIQSLRYGPYKGELESINERMIILIDELQIQPPFVLLRLVEWGFNLFEIGKLLRVNFVPSNFALVLHLIQTRVFRLHTGRVIRQIFYVPENFDPVIGTYFKSRRLIRIENFCHCNIVLLPPDDPRCSYCPNNYRTIEVNFDFYHGRYLGFCNLLNQCSTSKLHVARLAATIFRRLSGAEVDLTPVEIFDLDTNEPRTTYNDMRSDIINGTGTAIAPKIDLL